MHRRSQESGKLKPGKWQTKENVSQQIDVILDENSDFNKAANTTHYQHVYQALQEAIDVVESQQIEKKMMN